MHHSMFPGYSFLPFHHQAAILSTFVKAYSGGERRAYGTDLLLTAQAIIATVSVQQDT